MFVTFYSYKGGVGRSLSLSNIACLLAEDEEHPQRVLLWDFDLEAPGLHKLFPSKEPRPYGFVDLAYDYAVSGKIPRVSDYIYPSIIPNIDVLPAGSVDNAYADKLQQIDWASLFGEDPSSPGPLFGPLLEQIRQLDYDYVLIDSRTGLNDQAGICTQVLPDLLVVLFRLNDQNLDGLEHLVPSIRSSLVARRKAAVEMLPIASAVASTALKGIKEKRDRILSLFGASSLQYIHFDPDLVVEDRLVSLRAERSRMWPLPSVVDDYVKLCASIREKNESDTRTASDVVRRKMSAGDYASASVLLLPLLQRRPESARVWQTVEALNVTGRLPLTEIDVFVDQLIAENRKNYYALRWRAMRTLREADSPSSPLLAECLRYLREAAAVAPVTQDGYRDIARVASCAGDFDAAVGALRRSREQSPKNAQILIDLAHLHVRMGASYFVLAIDELEQLPDEIEDAKRVPLAYLRAFLGQREKARDALTSTDPSNSGRGYHRRQLIDAYVALFSGHHGEAKEIMSRGTGSTSHLLKAGDRANWIEFMVCAGEFGAAVALSDSPDGQRADHDATRALLVLARYLADENGSSRPEVVEAWRTVPSWQFLELLMFKELARKQDPQGLGARVDVIEDIVRVTEFAHLRGALGGGLVPTPISVRRVSRRGTHTRRRG